MRQSHTSRRSFIKHTALAGAGLALLPGSISACATETKKDVRLNGKKVLFVYGGWEGHVPEPSRDLFVPWLESEGAQVTVTDNLDSYADKVLMDSIDLVVQVMTMSEITREQEEGLLDAISNGMGIAGWHGGLGDSFRNNVNYQFMVGGQWVAHPGGVINYEVNITNKKDGVTQGLSDFNMHSEQYYMHVDPNVKVLATTTFNADHADWIDGATMPVVWKKGYGKGRVFYSSLGHNIIDFEVPEVMEIMKRGIRWASVSKYKPIPAWMEPVYPGKK